MKRRREGRLAGGAVSGAFLVGAGETFGGSVPGGEGVRDEVEGYV